MTSIDEIVVARDVMVAMRDGTHLATDVYRRQEGGPWPTLVHRTAYGKTNPYVVDTLMLSPLDAVERGYAVVVQDVRGTSASEGVFTGFAQERPDGHDTISWIAEQDWNNGDVGIYGSSYMGVTSSQAIVDAPSALKACIAYITSVNFRESWIYTGGAFELGFNVRWALMQATAALSRPGVHLARQQLMATQERLTSDPLAFFSSTMDVGELADQCGSYADLVRTWIEEGPDAPYWDDTDVLMAAERVAVPVLSIAGWYDGFVKSGIDLYTTLVAKSAPECRDHHRLIVGPWDHQSYQAPATLAKGGVVSYGAAATSGRAGLLPCIMDWFDRWLKGAPEDGRLPVRYFHMGPNCWEEAPSWPPANDVERWYLTSRGAANVTLDDGRLVRTEAASPPDSYIYDPARPVPTVGGRHLLLLSPAGPQDQRELAARDDVLVYTSDHLLEALSIAGAVRLDLFVRSSTPTTDFMATLIDVHPDGTALSIADGALRLSSNEGGGDVRFISVDLAYTAYTLPPGHRLRVHVMSSSFPRFDRNRNVGKDGLPGSYVVAVQHVLHDADHPSALVVSVRRI
jgi:putative CocE/NonD family hydrolase